MIRSFRTVGAGVLTLMALTLVPPAARGESAWRVLAPGLELGRFASPPSVVQVLRVDPERWETVAMAASDTGGESRTAEQWGREFGLVAVINAGMYATDHRTHVGFFRAGQHVNSGTWIRRDYRQVACFEPREPGRPPFVLVDLDAAADSTFAEGYDIVVQNLRLVRKPGENRWNPGTKRWSEACLGEDAQGRMLWIYCRHPMDMHSLNELLLELPLDLVAAQHLEGGPQAQLWVDFAWVSAETGSSSEYHKSHEFNNLSTPIPNVLGIRPRSR